MISLLRQLRHGPLKVLDPFWRILGLLFRRALSVYPNHTYPRKIGNYGPFQMASIFAFSNLEGWEDSHNNGFSQCVEFARESKCFFDVGAHVGYISLPVASVLPKGSHQVAFEPSDANLQKLKLHLYANNFNNVKIVQSLVGDRHGHSEMFYESVGHHGQNSQKPIAIEKLLIEHGRFKKSERPMISIDGFCTENNLIPDLIKMDIEGAEIDALRGARDVLSKHRPIIFLSVHPRHIEGFGYHIEDLKNEISAHRYTLLEMNGEEVSEIRLKEYVMAPLEHTHKIKEKINNV